MHAGIDGEAVDLAPPLAFVIRPAALRVRIAARDAGAPASLLRPARARARHASGPLPP